MEPTIAPVKKDKHRAATIFGKPKTMPKRKASFTSPKPMPFLFVIKNSVRKKINAPRPENNALMIDD